MDLEILWIPDGEFKKYIDDAGDKAELAGIDGKNRWVITGKDGVRYIVRPESAKENHEHINTTEMPQ